MEKQFIMSYDEFLNEGKPSKVGSLVTSSIIGSLFGAMVGIGVGAASMNPIAGIAAGVLVTAAFSSIGLLFYYKSLERWNTITALIIKEYGEDVIDEKQLEKLYDKFLTESERVKALKTKIVNQKSKIKAEKEKKNFSEVKQLAQKNKKDIETLIHYESSELASYDAYRVYTDRVNLLYYKYDEELLNQTLPNLHTFNSKLRELMEDFHNLNQVNYVQPVRTVLNQDDTFLSGAVKVANTVATNVMIKNDYNACIKLYEDTYKGKYRLYYDDIKEKYSDGYVLKESFDLIF